MLSVRAVRGLAKLRFRVLRRASIVDIPTDDFNRLVSKLRDEGWRLRREYEGFDAWIDYGRLKLRKGTKTLIFEWDNWTEGMVQGPRQVVEQIGREINRGVSYEWPWARYDDNVPAT